MKKNGQLVRFGDMAHNITDRVDDPATAGVERYVGLEHLDPESLTIRRWGTPDEVEATKLRFYPGDIIFGKRRFYQRKLAVADFEGICSAHALVLRAKEDICLPEFLPFFMQSDVFYERAMGISVGSLSPTINWSALAKQEFYVPTLDEQNHISEILWALEDNINTHYDVLLKLRMFKKVISYDLFTGRVNKQSSYQHWQIKKMEEISYSINNGFVGTAAKHYIEDGIPYLTSTNVRENYIDTSNLTFITKAFHEANVRSQLKTGDLLTVQSGHIGISCVVPPYLDGANCHAIIISRLDENVVKSEFIAYYLNSFLGRRRLSKIFIGTTVPHINTTDFRKFTVPVPPIEDQKKILDILWTLDKNLSDVNSHIEKIKVLKKSLIDNLI